MPTNKKNTKKYNNYSSDSDNSKSSSSDSEETNLNSDNSDSDSASILESDNDNSTNESEINGGSEIEDDQDIICELSISVKNEFIKLSNAINLNNVDKILSQNNDMQNNDMQNTGIENKTSENKSDIEQTVLLHPMLYSFYLENKFTAKKYDYILKELKKKNLKFKDTDFIFDKIDLELSLNMSVPIPYDILLKPNVENVMFFKKYNALSLYDWIIKNWGTENDCFDIVMTKEFNKLTYNFKTVSKPPLKWLKHIKKLYPQLIFNFKYYDIENETYINLEYMEHNQQISYIDILKSVKRNINNNPEVKDNPAENINDTTVKLKDYQIDHVNCQIKNFINNDVITDTSDTGTGKTYTSLFIAKYLGLRVFIICPKPVMTSWNKVCKSINVGMIGIVNYELIKNGKYYNHNGIKDICPYIDIFYNSSAKIDYFKFNLPYDTLLIFDEVHKSKNATSANSKLLQSIIFYRQKTIKTLLLSATMLDRIKFFKPYGVVLGYYPKIEDFRSWLARIRKQYAIKISDWERLNELKNNNEDGNDSDGEMNKELSNLLVIRDILKKDGKTSRMTKKQINDLNVKHDILYNLYTLKDSEELEECYNQLEAAMEELKNSATRSSALGKIIKIRQRIELLKLPLFIEEAKDALSKGYSVAIFVNYIHSLEELCSKLDCNTYVVGGQTTEVRDACINDFQTNKSKCIILTIGAGGASISIHDTIGKCKRMSIISPTWSGQDLEQVFGRIYRSGVKSDCVQKVIYVKDTYEETICKIMNDKIKNIHTFNDGNILGPKFQKYEIDLKKMEKKQKKSGEILTTKIKLQSNRKFVTENEN